MRRPPVSAIPGHLDRDQRARPGGRARVEGGVGPTCLLGKGCKSSNRMNHPLLDLNATPAPCPSPSCLASGFAMTREPSVLVEPPSDWRLNHPNQHLTRNQPTLTLTLGSWANPLTSLVSRFVADSGNSLKPLYPSKRMGDLIYLGNMAMNQWHTNKCSQHPIG